MPAVSPHAKPPPRLGLVLGAGGVAGAAYHAGTLLALHHHLGWDPREADIVVGTSAGSIVGALLRAGVAPEDLAAWCAGAPPSEAGREARALLDYLDATETPVRSPRTWPVVNPALWFRPTSASEIRLNAVMMSMMPPGSLAADRNLRRVGELLPDGWPQRPLWINAVRTTDARRVVFGQRRQAPLGPAVAASCAIPGYFRPVRIGRHRYIDGAAYSPTNAELLAGAAVDTVIVLSPMSAQPGSTWFRRDAFSRMLSGRTLRAEAAALWARGTKVHLFEPGRDVLDAMGYDALDRSRAATIVRESFLAAGDELSRLGADHPLGLLQRRRPTPRPGRTQAAARAEAS